MAKLVFRQAALRAIVTTSGSRRVTLEEEQERLGLSGDDLSRLKRTIGLSERRIVEGPVTTSDLCEASARHIFSALNIDPASLDGLILVTQSPDYRAPSSGIHLAARLGLTTDALAFDINLGCSGFVYGLAQAYALVEAGLNRILVCVGDVASRFVDSSDHAVAPIMGDAGAVVLVERRPSQSVFVLHSDGRGYKALYIPNSGFRADPADEGKQPLMAMDGAAVFNFTLKRVPALISEILEARGWTASEVDYFVLHQPNKYILKNIQKRLGLGDEKLPSSTQSMFGNQNSASIPGTVTGFLSQDYQARALKSVFAGFGIGLSWGACALETESIYTPPTFYYTADAHG